MTSQEKRLWRKCFLPIFLLQICIQGVLEKSEDTRTRKQKDTGYTDKIMRIQGKGNRRIQGILIRSEDTRTRKQKDTWCTGKI